MKTVTVNLSFRDTLLGEIDAEARRESRSRSELIREAARQYVERQRRWNHVFSLGDRVAKEHDLKETDVSREISRARSRRRHRE